MKLVVFGANGGIGHHVVEQALEAGHEVTAVVRRPASITIQHERLHVVKADVLEPDSLTPAVAGSEAVISTIGITGRAPTTLYSQGTANIVQAMKAAGARRLICVSASTLDPGGPLVQRWFAKPLLWRILKNSYDDLVRMEAIVEASGLDWTILRPPRLTNGARTGHVRDAVNQPLPGSWTLSRADLAAYMLGQLNQPRTYCAVVEVAY